MADLRKLREDVLVTLYDNLNMTGPGEEHDSLVKAIKEVENAIANDAKLDTDVYLAELKKEADLAKLDYEERENKQKRKVEVIKLAVDAILKFGAGSLVITMVAWILKQEQTGTITSKAFSLLTKSLPKIL